MPALMMTMVHETLWGGLMGFDLSTAYAAFLAIDGHHIGPVRRVQRLTKHCIAVQMQRNKINRILHNANYDHIMCHG